jgi:hypothetical protein
VATVATTKSSRRPAKKPAKKAATSAAKKKNGARGAGTQRGAVGAVLSDHRADLWGVGFVVFGLLAAVSVWLGAAGRVGEGLDDLLALALGLVRVRGVGSKLEQLGQRVVVGRHLLSVERRRIGRDRRHV